MSKRVVKKTRDTAERGSVSTFKASKKANVDDTDSVSDSDEEIDMLVEKSLASFRSSKVSDSKSFSALTDRIFDSKNVRKDLVAANGIMMHQSSKQGHGIKDSLETSAMYDASKLAAPSLTNIKSSVKKSTLGKGWFDSEPLELDENIKRDIKIIQMRNYLDPKRFYKNPDKMRNILHVGTVIEGPGEYNSARLRNRDRRQTIVEEILSDKSVTDYSKRTYLQIQRERSNKRKTYKESKPKGQKKKLRSLF